MASLQQNLRYRLSTKKFFVCFKWITTKNHSMPVDKVKEFNDILLNSLIVKKLNSK
uniref:Uncharacterized protein n=1 Tax=Rhizophora mucronata TaxID=61149 RepID=A0A2P2QGE7_RHIMU